ncbi:hypothetical protein, partial [Escherichia coli]|uniref:hypothetical protein n=1 Tax=Escherichia coli TaxID=562 RepID=UPI001BFC4D09
MQSWLSPETNRVWQGWRGTLHPVRVFPADAGLRRFTVRCFRIFSAAAFHAADAASFLFFGASDITGYFLYFSATDTIGYFL